MISYSVDGLFVIPHHLFEFNLDANDLWCLWLSEIRPPLGMAKFLTGWKLKQQASLRAAQIKAQTDIAKQQMGMEKDAGSLAIKQNESIIKQQDADTRRAQLMLQRDALINQIISQQSEPVDKDNVSKAGTMARDYVLVLHGLDPITCCLDLNGFGWPLHGFGHPGHGFYLISMLTAWI